MFNRETSSGLLIGAAAGTVSGLTGLGGGVVLIPLMLAMLGFTQHKAHGTSLAIVAITAVAGAIQYARLGYLDAQLAIELASGSVIGVLVGARLMARVPAKQLRRGFGLLLLLVGVKMLVG